ncbi:MAG: lysine--tRNA ligase [Alphaproteobacteria bacterium]
MSDLRDLALNARAWPFEEARKVLKRYEKKDPEKGYVLFETGYGPSGLPHIGTFGEVLRTTMVRRAFELMSDIPTKLIAFSDDMDGLRKVPDNVPNKDQLQAALNKRLTKVPDPFGTHESFGHHNNNRLREFLDGFGFEYEFASSTDYYFSGRFDDALIRVLECYEKIQAIMLPSLRDERRGTYSPFLPVDPETDEVYQVPVIATDAARGTIVYRREDGQEIETPVTGGRCKLQWKPDWGMRWYALGVDYEMSGKDLIDSVKLSSRICQALGAPQPETLTYELFLDEEGQKISKSKGNGLSMEEWLRYAPNESLALFMFQKPKAAKRLYFDVIPKAVDEYLTFLAKFGEEPEEKRLENPIWHIHNGNPPTEVPPISFGLLLNLAAVCNSEDKAVLWGFISRYAPDATAEANPTLDSLVGFAIRYYQDFVKPKKAFKAPDATDRAAIEDLRAVLAGLPADATAEDIQTEVYEVGKRHQYENLRDWFKALYQVLLGQEQGPRIGSFFALYGLSDTIALIDRALAGEDLSAA